MLLKWGFRTVVLKQKLVIGSIFGIGVILFIFSYIYNSNTNRHHDDHDHVHYKQVALGKIKLSSNTGESNEDNDLTELENAKDHFNNIFKNKNRLKEHLNFDNNRIGNEIRKRNFLYPYSNYRPYSPQPNSNMGQFNDFFMPQQQRRSDEEKKALAEMKTSLDKLERLVHIDLKGAPPKVDYFKQFIPFIKKFGATGIILEYEDMFPFEGILKPARHGNAYSVEDVNLIVKLATDNGLKIMPLVQTYGHLEWLLKHKNFAHLREHKNYPQVITPCLEESYTVIFEMLDQVIKLHPNVPFFHIGCDEVYYKLVHANCSSPKLLFDGDFGTAFMNHTIRVAQYVRKKLPNTKIIIWNDMLQNLETLYAYKEHIVKNEIEPMIWAYVEDVEKWFNDAMYLTFGQIFKNVWSASAFKGASGELTTITNIDHHYKNQISWNKVMHAKMKNNICNFAGVAITGWSRYDHFLAPCDLLPQAIPSLVVCLQAAQLGEIDYSKRLFINTELGCKQNIPWKPEEIYDMYMSCTFPGHEVYEAVLPMKVVLQALDENIDFANKYMTPVSLNYNYAHSARARETIQRLDMSYGSLVRFKSTFERAADTMYWNDTKNEWLEVYLTPHLHNLYEYIKAIKSVMKTKNWEPRPLPIKAEEFPDFVE